MKERSRSGCSAVQGFCKNDRKWWICGLRPPNIYIYQICRKYFKYGYLHIHIFRSMHVMLHAAGFKYFIVFLLFINRVKIKKCPFQSFWILDILIQNLIFVNLIWFHNIYIFNNFFYFLLPPCIEIYGRDINSKQFYSIIC